MKPSTPPPKNHSALHNKLAAALRASVVVDVETTGLDPTAERIVEIALLEVRDGMVQRRFHSLVNPGRPIPTETTRIHGIRDEDVSEAPNFQELLRHIGGVIGSRTLVGHNVAFDAEFLDSEARRAHGELLSQPSTLCTAATSRLLIPREAVGRYTLANVAKYFGLEIRDSHRASADAELTFEVLTHLERLSRESRGL